MKDEVKQALCYFYCLERKNLCSGKLKGLKRKQVLDFLKLIDDLSIAISTNKILDLEEVLSYGKSSKFESDT